jgi:hypothetical protein
MIAPDPVFNELSVGPLATDPSSARARVAGLIEVLIRAPDHGLGTSLRISEGFYLLELAPDYTFNDWINDTSVPVDKLRFFLSLAAKAPFFQQQDEPALYCLDQIDVSCNDQSHPAFLCAYFLDAALVSFDHDFYSQPLLPITVSRLDDDGEIFSEEALQVNLAQLGQFDFHSDWFLNRWNAVVSPTDLWNRRHDLYPALVFCEAVEDELLILGSILPLIADRLADIQRVASTRIPFDKDAFRSKCNPTAQSTFEQFGSCYDFRNPDGVRIRCGWHLYLPDGCRVYFAPGSASYTIGHIGKHLPTSRYP